MSGLPWYRCYPRDFNDGMVGLTMEERGAYVTILNVIYARGGPVPDDAGYFRALLCCGGKTWSKVRASLIFKGRLFEVNLDGRPSLMDERAAREIAEVSEKTKKFSEGGSRGGKTTQAKVKEIKGFVQAPLEAGLSDTDTDVDKEPPTPFSLAPLAKLIGLSASGGFEEIAEAIWLAQPSPGGKRRTTRPDVQDALAAAIKRGAHPGEVLRAIRAFYALPANRKDAGQYANGAKVVMAKDRWREYLPAKQAQPPPSDIDPAYRAHLERHFLTTGEWKPEWGEKPRKAA